MANTLVGLYDDMTAAQQAVSALREAGIAGDRISLVAHDVGGEYGRSLQGSDQKTGGGGSTAAGAGIGAALGGLGGLLVGLGALAIPGIGPVIAAGPIATGLAALAGAGVGAVAGGVAGGLIGALVDAGVPEEEAGYYAEGVRRGGALLTVTTDDQMVDQARQIMDRFHPVDIQQRAEYWRQSGWKGYDEKAKPYTADLISQERSQFQKLNQGGQVTMPVVEEQLAVGKRQVQTGGVRVHRNVTERPVEEDVSLRREHVNVERRPVDRPASPGMLENMQEGTMEVSETSEEAVVQKKARVVEEVVVNKTAEQKTEKVRDTVRRSDVQVEQTQGDGQRYRDSWRENYQQQYASTGRQYDYYDPAYEYGMSLRQDNRYRDYDWNRLEPEARRTWEQRYPKTPWDQIKDAVRYSWDRVKQGASD